jgi:hypothetical protein
MTKPFLDIKTGQTIEEAAAAFADELELDVVGMWAVVAFGRERFNLTGDQLTIFTRTCVSEMLSRGAVPLRSDGMDPRRWVKQPQYGSIDHQIVDQVIIEWLGSGVDTDYGLWFGTQGH